MRSAASRRTCTFTDDLLRYRMAKGEAREQAGTVLPPPGCPVSVACP